jgi:hypothetical protein
VNAQIQRLAPVLNSATLTDDVQVTGTDVSVPVDVLVKSTQGDRWIFASAMRQGETTATFIMAGAGSGTVEVVDEGRELPMTDGQFQDDFAGDYAVHIYRIPGAG